MSELIVIYDPAQELAAVVNVDERVGWGPTMIGPRAGEVLQAFLDTVPFDADLMDSYMARSAFEQFLDRVTDAAPVEADAGTAEAVEPSADSGMADYAAADTEASNTPSEPPSPAPADTDMAADAGTTATLVTCPNCNGEGSVRLGDDDALTVCGMCHGQQRIEVQVPV